VVDDLVESDLQRERNREAEGVGGLQIEHALELRRLHNGHRCRFCPAQDLAHIFAGLAVHPADARSVTQQSAYVDKLADEIESRHRLSRGERYDLLAAV
jgi:hypothetical protein